MEALILCRFDPTYGPKIFLKAPASLDEELIKEIPTLMEFRSKGVFIHIFEQIKSSNLFFKIPSAIARGKKEGFLISIITDVNSNLKLMFARELLESFATNLINLEDAFEAFSIDSKNFKANPTKLKEVENLFFSFFNSFKPALRTLKIAEDRYQSLFKAARDVIFILDYNLGIIIDANLAAEKLTEMPREDLMGIQPSQLEIFNIERWKTNIFEHLSTETTTPVFVELKKSNGKTLFMEVNVNEIDLGEQQLVQYIFHDITEIKVAEQKLQEHARNIEILYKIIDVSSQTDDLSELLNNLLEYISTFLNLDGCCIYIVDKQTQLAEIKASKGFSLSFREKNNFFNIDQNPYDLVYLKGVATFNDNFPKVINKFFEGSEFVSMAIIPLFSKFEIIGSINLALNSRRTFSNEEKNLFISIGLEIGTAIEKMKSEEILRQSEKRNRILLNHIPFSIIRLSDKGIFLDIKLDKKIEKLINNEFSPKDFLGRSINEVLSNEDAKKSLDSIEHALRTKKSEVIKFVLPINNNQLVFEGQIVPIGKFEVLAFIQNLTRT